MNIYFLIVYIYIFYNYLSLNCKIFEARLTNFLCFCLIFTVCNVTLFYFGRGCRCLNFITAKTIDVKNVGKIIKNVKKRKKRYKNKKR